MNANEPPKDHVERHGPNESRVQDHLSSKATWMRLLFMILMGLIFGLGVIVGSFVVIMQFFWVLFTGESKKELETIGRQLGDYAREIALYMTFNTEERPFPFDRDWPSG